MKHIKKARVYRFHELVALSIDNGAGYQPNFYITQDMAFALARMLMDAGSDCIHTQFSESMLGTHVVAYDAELAQDFRAATDHTVEKE